ncbi:MFS transporter [Flavobacteriaceae bacterium S0825]|uniref:MFS transporter n=1 Tax=Gaetbulibacter sp. S0825 TaxID=2720084 RepID=UPI0014319D5F|nr:MFS transporter [Gaetbulibacter sp. S0825]MCK0110442.1 MFS transporter [Flavobacteriaceae bacterium S0825]NIX66071.1 MFS transporter [Gaetbulibacter sp. S0825]
MKSKIILPIIVFSQFCCTSLWFAGNGVMADLISTFNLNESALGHITSAVQFGFISGTLVFALLTISDRFSPSKVFFFCALIAALFNLGAILENNSFFSLFILKYFTGFFLAGIYPVGMKIAADFYDKGLGKSLGFLVGALVVGTAFPHLLKGYSFGFSWQYIIVFISILALFGGLLMLLFVPNGPYRKASQKLKLNAWLKNFKDSKFRSAAFGYFGHMWELYTFWAFVPVILSLYKENNLESTLNIPLWSFIIIGVGGLSCVVSGYLSSIFKTKKVAFTALLLSCLCCLISPFIFLTNSESILLSFLVFWGMVVIADSPLFSTLIAQNAIPKYKGTALTIVNCIGFAITIISIQLLNYLHLKYNSSFLYMILVIGPILGLIALSRKPITHD